MAQVTIKVNEWAAGWVDELYLNVSSHTSLKDKLTSANSSSSSTSCTLKKNDTFKITGINIVQSKNGKLPNPNWTIYCSVNSSYENDTWYVYFNSDGSYSHGDQKLDVNVNLDRTFTLNVYVQDNGYPALPAPDDGGDDNTGGEDVGGGDVGTGFKVEIRPYFNGSHQSSKDWDYSTTGTVKVNNIIDNYSGYEFQYAKKGGSSTQYYSGDSISVSSSRDYIKTYYTTIEDEEEDTGEWFKTEKATTIKKSTSDEIYVEAYEIYGITIKAEQNCIVEIYTEQASNADDLDALYNIGSTSSNCKVTYYIDAYGDVNPSGTTKYNSEQTISFTDTIELEKGEYLEYAWFNYKREYADYYYEITITPAVVNYTITPYASTGIASVSGGGTVQSGSSTSITATPKNGYKFSQWVDEAATPYTDNPLYISNVTSNQSYWASAEPIEYEIEYNDDKQGTTTGTIRKTYTIETATFSLHTLTKTGYTFNGWYTTSNFTGTAVTQITNGSTGKKTFYAKWTPVEYSITYNLNSGSLPTDPAPLNKYTVETETYTLPTPTRTNYEFQGWYENSGLTGTAVTQLSQGSTGNKTYYAKWKLKNYTISYNMNGGSGTIASHYSNGTTFTPSTTIPTKTGQAFIGWNTSSSATTAQYNPGVNATISSNLTLYAIWKPLITFKWTDNNYETHKTSQYLSDLSSTADIPSNYHVSQAEVQRLINLIKTYCGTTITIDEKRLATLYNNIAAALRNSSDPQHHSGSTAPTTNTLPNVTAGNAITVDDFLKLENAFNNRKFI